MLSIIVLEDDALQRHRVSRLLDEAVEESKAVVDGLCNLYGACGFPADPQHHGVC